VIFVILEEELEYRELGKTGTKVSAVGFGCWAMWASGWGDVDDSESISAARRALDLGINFFDTAPGYGFNHSEKVLAKALEGKRKEAFLATKCGIDWEEKTGKIWKNSSPAYIRKDCERSLQTLNTDRIDLLQVHWPDEKVPISDTMGELAKLQKEGKIKYIGVSNYSVAQMKECRKYIELVSLQPPFSMLNRGVEQEILPFCLEQKISALAYSPIQQGLLTGKYTRDAVFPENDMRLHNPMFKGVIFEKIIAAVEEFKKMAKGYGRTMTQFAINWVLCNPALTVAIVGAKKPAQVEENAGGAGWKISDEDLKKTYEILDRLQQEIMRQLAAQNKNK